MFLSSKWIYHFWIKLDKQMITTSKGVRPLCQLQLECQHRGCPRFPHVKLVHCGFLGLHRFQSCRTPKVGSEGRLKRSAFRSLKPASSTTDACHIFHPFSVLHQLFCQQSPPGIHVGTDICPNMSYGHFTNGENMGNMKNVISHVKSFSLGKYSSKMQPPQSLSHNTTSLVNVVRVWPP